MKKILGFTLLFFVVLVFLDACSESNRVSVAKDIVINEVMASNRTGLRGERKRPSDWIELKNNSGDSVNLKGFSLAVISLKTDSIDKTKTEEVEKTWEFPGVTIGAGDFLLVFADKAKKSKKKDAADDGEDEEADSENSLDYVPGSPLVAGFKLPKEGGTIQFRAPDGRVLSEVKYENLGADMALARQNDGSYITTYLQSPGFENNPEGYEKAVMKIDGQRSGPLLIWEVMSREENSSLNWVELKNVGDSAINLSEYELAKKLGKEEGWKLPDKILQPGEFITIQTFGKTARPSDVLHANFKLGNAETVVLTKGGKFVDGANAKETPPGVSIGRMKGKKGWFYFSTPTKNQENAESGKRFISDSPVFDLTPGIYPKDKSLTLKLKDNKRVVRYTLDGTIPTSNSPVFKDSLLITKNTVVRSFAEGDSVSLRSPTATSTYILGVEHDMPVVNITVNERDLYDYKTGIYAEGPGFNKEWPHTGANYWKDWTKSAHVEFFDNIEGREGFSVDCGLAIFGGFSRAEAKKSFRLKFRHRYGTPAVDYDFFDDGEIMELEDLVLRSGSQDYNRCMVRDEFFTSLMAPQSPNLLIQKYRPAALYINGKYFGLYYLREKINSDFVARKLNLPSNDQMNIIMSVGYNEVGSKEAFQQLMNYVSSHDLSKRENYEYIKNLVDLEGLVDFKLGEMYSGNTDAGNIRYVRSLIPESDRKWHFVFYDLDASWVGYKPKPNFYISTGPEATKANVSRHNILIAKLLKNPEFRALFLQRLSHHLANTFSTENTTKVFDALVERIRPEMERNCERWPQLGYQKWEENIVKFREKFNDKNKVLLDDIRVTLSVTDEENKKYFSNLGY